MDSLVAINIFDKNGIINNNGVPMLYYWNGDTDVKNDLLVDKTFIELLEKKVLNTDNFGDSSISYFYFINDNDEEKCETVSSLIQNFVGDDIINNMGIRYIIHHLNYLYVCSYKENYSFTDDFENDILNIYELLKQKHPNKITIETIKNYVRSELLQTNHLTTKNIEKIIKIINNIFIHYGTD